MSTATQPERKTATPKDSVALVLSAGNLPDLSKPAELVKFAALFSGDQLSKLSAEQQAVFLTSLGNHIGVRAELGEIMLYQGKPYITIDGRIRIAHKSALLNGIDPQPASSMERARYGAKDGEHLWKCYVFKKGAVRPFVGWGHVRSNDRNPVSKTHPQEIAKKRAKYDALRLAFPPDEEVTPLHQQYIHEAEEEAARISRAPTQLPRMDAGGYDFEEAPDDQSVIGEEVAVVGAPPSVVDDSPILENDVDASTMTLEEAKKVGLIGPPGSWQGRVGTLLDTFSTPHLHKIKQWLVEKIEERGDDPDKQTMVTAINLIVADRDKAQTALEFDSTKTAAAVEAKQAASKKNDEKGALPF